MILDRTERQKLGIKKWVESGCRGTLQWCTGVGKTRAGIMAIKAFISKNSGKSIVIVVPTDYLKIQWIEELSKNSLLPYASVEIINSSVKVSNQIDFLIIDEAHRIPSDTFFEVFNQRSPKIVLGLSATFSRLDGRHELLNKYCPVCDVINIKEAIDNKWLAPYKEYKVIITPSDIDVYRELNKQFLNLFAFFNNDFTLAMQCVGGIRKGNIVVKPSHFVRYEYAKSLCSLDRYSPHYESMVKSINAEVTANAFSWNRALQARKAYIMNHPKKIEVARRILDARADKKVITFSATIAQAEKIGRGYLVHSGNTKKKNRITMVDFAALKVGVINTAKSLDEGSDVPGLNTAIVLCNTSSQTQKTQRVGRVVRYEEGKEAEIFTLVIKGTVEEGWYNTSTAGKNYIEITEDELEEILDGKQSNNLVKEAKEQGLLFRL